MTIATSVPFPGVERTRILSVNVSMMVNPMPLRVSSPVVNMGWRACSTFSMPHPASFTFMRSFDILTMVVLGGLGSMTGSITGAILLTFISAYLAEYPEWRMIIYSVTMIVLMLHRPQGLFGNKELSMKMFGLGGGKDGRTAESK